MLFSQDRDQIRRFFCAVHRKQRARLPLDPLEALIAEVIALHPEYQPLLDNPDRAQGTDYPPEHGRTNPFLHMGMHIAIREQLGAGQPAGLALIHQQLGQRYGDAHEAEHQMMEVLGETLWEAQRDGTAPDQQRYLQRLRQRLRSH